MKHGIVNRTTESYFTYQGWPTICKDENGTLYVASSGHRLGHVCPFGKNLLYTSHDDGETWSAPRIINDTPMDDRDAGLTYLGEGKLLLSWFNLSREWSREHTDIMLKYYVSEDEKELALGMLKALYALPEERAVHGSYVRLSRDYGESWEEAVKVPTTAPHGPICLKNGKLLYFGKCNFAEYNNRNGIVVAQSCDDGKTWEVLCELELPDIVTRDDCHEPHAVELPNGRILAAIRAHGKNVTDGFSILLCHSDDGGKTWSIPTPTGFSGSPPHLMLHSSGAVILSYARRHRQPCECARVSYDGGETWGEEIELDSRSKNGDLGYPSTAELSDGSLITVYYQRYEDDKKCSVLYTKWELPARA